MDYGAKIGRRDGTEGTNEGKRKPAGGTSGHTKRRRDSAAKEQRGETALHTFLFLGNVGIEATF